MLKRWTPAAALLVWLVQVWVPPAHAETAIAVATFDDDRIEAPGALARRRVRIANVGDEAVPVQITPRAVDLLNDGMTRMRSEEDPLWAGRISISPSELRLDPRASQDIDIAVAIPANAAPDDYLLGILVTPVVTAAGLTMVNEVGMLVPLTVDGDRVRALTITEHHLPSVVIGDSITGSLRLANIGNTMAAAWAEISVHNDLLHSDVTTLQLNDRVRLGPGTSRDMTYTWAPGVTFGRFTLPVRVTYNRENATTAELAVSDDVWYVHPLIPLWSAAAMLAGVAVLIRRRFA